jgi:hypothetical protein
MSQVIGQFRLVGKWVGTTGEGLALEVEIEGVGGVYVRKFPLQLDPDRATTLTHDWLHPSHLYIEGNLLGKRDTVDMEPTRLVLLRGNAHRLNEAWATVYIQERVAETVYLVSASEEGGDEVFPVESQVPLLPKRLYHLFGRLSPRYYERQKLLQIRLKVAGAMEGLDALRLG